MRMKMKLTTGLAALLSVLVSQTALAVPLFSTSDVLTKSDLSDKAAKIFEQQVSSTQVRSFELLKFSRDLIKFENEQQVRNDYPTFEFPLPGGATVSAILRTVYTHPSGLVTWVGRISGDQYSLVTLSVDPDGHMAAEMNSFGSAYSFKPIDSEIVVARSVQQLPHSQEDMLLRSTNEPAVSTQSLQSKEDGSVIDMWVFYSNDALAGSAAIQTEIANDIAYTNAALDQSCTQTSLRLVGTSLLTITEHRQGDLYLNELSNPDDGVMDEIWDTLRDNGIDMAQLWVEQTMGSDSNAASIGQVGGIAYSPIPYPGFFTPFSVKARAQPARTTAHEIGHNFTVMHDRFQCPSTSLNKNYAQQTGFGYVDLENKTFDIMSYSTECSFHGLDCEALPYFSNPRLMIHGRPFGIGNQADGAYQIFKHRTRMANIRQAATATTSPAFSLCEETLQTGAKLDKCFIATAAWNSFLDPKVTVLRQFRDSILEQSVAGRWLIDTYYELSPPLANWLNQNEWAKPPVRAALWVVAQLASALMTPSLFKLIALTLISIAAISVLYFSLKLSVSLSFRLSRKLSERTRLWVKSTIALCLLTLLSPQPAQGNIALPSLLPDHRVLNPATLISRTRINSASVVLQSQDSSYKSEQQTSQTNKIQGATRGELRAMSPDFGIFLSYQSETEIKTEWPKGTETENWATKSSGYSVAANYSLFSNFQIGIGYLNQQSTLDRPPAYENGDYGTRSTEWVESLDIGTLGMRLALMDGEEFDISLGGLLEYGKHVSTDQSRHTVARLGSGIGFGVQEGALLAQLDLGYLVAPQSVESEGRPIAAGVQYKSSGWVAEVGMKYVIEGLLHAIGAGYSTESLNTTGYNGEGEGSRTTNNSVKASVWILNDLIGIHLVSTESKSVAGPMTRSEKSTLARASLMF